MSQTQLITINLFDAYLFNRIWYQIQILAFPLQNLPQIFNCKLAWFLQQREASIVFNSNFRRFLFLLYHISLNAAPWWTDNGFHTWQPFIKVFFNSANRAKFFNEKIEMFILQSGSRFGKSEIYYSNKQKLSLKCKTTSYECPSRMDGSKQIWMPKYLSRFWGSHKICPRKNRGAL